MRSPYDGIPDVRDGLTREERVVLYVLDQTQKERASIFTSVRRTFQRCLRGSARENDVLGAAEGGSCSGLGG